VLFGSDGNLYAVRYVYIYTHCVQHRDAGQAKEIKQIRTAVNAVLILPALT